MHCVDALPSCHIVPCALLRCAAFAMQLEAELKELEQQSGELQVEGQHAISEYKVCVCGPRLPPMAQAGTDVL